jgi:hypothetical protein
MIYKTASAVFAIVMAGAAALTTSDALAYRSTARHWAGHAAKYSSPRIFPKIDPGSAAAFVRPRWVRPAGTGGKVSKLIPATKPSPLQWPTPARDKDKLSRDVPRIPSPCLPGQSTAKNGCYGVPKNPDPGPSTNPKPGTPSTPGHNNWPGGSDGPVVSLPDGVEQPASVSAPERVVTVERSDGVSPRAVEPRTQACAIPPLAAMIDELLLAARLSATERAYVKAMRAAMADLAAAGNEAGARELEANAMIVFGYRKVWLRCGAGAFTWEQAATPG